MRTLVFGLAIVCLQISASAASELTGTLKRINDRSQMNLGFRESEHPMSFRNRFGNAVGYSIDLCDHIVAAVKQKLGRSDITVNYVPVTAENRFTAIETGSIDILCGATTKTLGRSERVGFTQLTFATGASLLSLSDAKVFGIADLKGKRVAVVANTTTIVTLKGVLKDGHIDAKVVPVSSATAGMAAMSDFVFFRGYWRATERTVGRSSPRPGNEPAEASQAPRSIPSGTTPTFSGLSP